MLTFRQIFLACGVFACGYAVGSCGLFDLPRLVAQIAEDGIDLSEEALERVRAAHDALGRAMGLLEGESRYSSAVQGVNVFAVSVGGIDAVQDLEDGRGVDPETFAALYAGRAIPNINQHLTRDSDGRVTYKGRLVRMYSTARLKQIFTERDKLTGADL